MKNVINFLSWLIVLMIVFEILCAFIRGQLRMRKYRNIVKHMRTIRPRDSKW